MGKLINLQQAKEHLGRIADPVIQAVIQHAPGAMFVGRLVDDLEGEFDLLFFYKTLEATLRDREMLARALTGELTHSFGKD